MERRKKEWLLEDEMADAEVVEVVKQELVNEIKIQQIEKKFKNIENEIFRSEQTYEILSQKFTNNELYVWLEKELGVIFKQYVELLLEIARMAERVYHFEIDGEIKSTYEFIKNDYWDNFRKGLLAPERVLLDLRRMEKAYLENDVHEMKITRPISLKELQENAELFKCDEGFRTPLTDVRTNCSCEFQLTKTFFSENFEGHFFQRIQDVQIFVKLSGSSMPCYLNAELSLTEGLVDYGMEYPLSLMVSDTTMATGLAYYQPGIDGKSYNSKKTGVFEGCGAISKWSLSVSGIKKNSDDNNAKYPIEDVIVYLTYTARKGGTRV